MKNHILDHIKQLFLSLFGLAFSPFTYFAVATFDVTKQVPQGRPQNTRRVELVYTLDFSAAGKLGDGTGLAANEDMEIGDIPAGFTMERFDPKLITAEGEAATMHVGTEATPTLFATSLNLNGTPNAVIPQNPSAVAVAAADAATQSGSYVQADVQTIATLANELKADLTSLVANVNTERAKAGLHFATTTPIRVTCPNGANTINAAKVRLTFVGYMSDTGSER